MKLVLAFLLCGALGSIQMAAADALKTAPMTEAPLVVTSGYGVDGLVLWLAADSGVKMDESGNVSALTDKTGNFTLTARDPDLQPTLVPNVLNGKPVLRFNPDESLSSADDFGPTLDRDMTLIVVAKTEAARTFFQYPLYLGQNRTSHANRALAYYKGTEVFDGQWVSFYGPPVVRKAFAVLGISVNPTVTQATFYQDGKQMMLSSISKESGKASFENLSPGITLGAATDPCRGWLGDIAEVLVYDRQLSPAEMQTIWFSLSNKYEIQPPEITTASSE